MFAYSSPYLRALIKVERAVRGNPRFADAYEAGRLSWVRVTTLLPVIDRQTADAWILRANAVTVRRLAGSPTR